MIIHGFDKQNTIDNIQTSMRSDVFGVCCLMSMIFTCRTLDLRAELCINYSTLFRSTCSEYVNTPAYLFTPSFAHKSIIRMQTTPESVRHWTLCVCGGRSRLCVPGPPPGVQMDIVSVWVCAVHACKLGIIRLICIYMRNIYRTGIVYCSQLGGFEYAPHNDTFVRFYWVYTHCCVLLQL